MVIVKSHQIQVTLCVGAKIHNKLLQKNIRPQTSVANLIDLQQKTFKMRLQTLSNGC